MVKGIDFFHRSALFGPGVYPFWLLHIIIVIFLKEKDKGKYTVY